MALPLCASEPLWLERGGLAPWNHGDNEALRTSAGDEQLRKSILPVCLWGSAVCKKNP